MYSGYRPHSKACRKYTFISSFTIPFRNKKFIGKNGFTLLELIIVIFLITLITGLSVVFFANFLPSAKFNTTVRDIVTSVRQARTLAQLQGERQVLAFDLDSKKYGIEGRQTKTVPEDVQLKIIDPFFGEIIEGKYNFIFHAQRADGGRIVLSDDKRTANIIMDPVIGSVVINE